MEQFCMFFASVWLDCVNISTPWEIKATWTPTVWLDCTLRIRYGRITWHFVSNYTTIHNCTTTDVASQLGHSFTDTYNRWQNNFPVITKHLYTICTRLDQLRRRWADVVQMLYKCFLFAGLGLTLKGLQYFYINHGDLRGFSIWNHHKCLS